MMSLWEVLKTSKGLPAPDGFTALFARSLSDTYTLAEISGSPPLNLGEIVEIVDYTIYGNTYQADGVSPDTPQEVKGCGERTGNLFNGEYEVGNIDPATGELLENSGRYRATNFIPVMPNTTYTFSKSSGTGFFWVIGYKDDFTGIEDDTESQPAALITTSKNNENIVVTFTTTPTTRYVKWYTTTKSGLPTQLNSGSTPLPYEPYGYKIPLVTRGKNLVRVADDNYIYYSALNNFTIQGDKLILTNETLVGFKVKVKPNTTYTIQRKRESNIPCNFRIREYSVEPIEWETDFLKQSINVPADYASFTSSADTAWVLVVFYITRSAGSLTISDIQLELGTEATSYEPYTPPITTPIYLDSPLYKIGDYADVRGMTEDVRAIKELVLTGEEDWALPTENTFRLIVNGYLRELKLICICTHYKAVENIEYLGSNFSDKSITFLVSTSGNNYCYIRDKSISDTTAWKAYLKKQYNNGTPVTVYYVLAEPESRAVEPVDIPTLNGTTVIDVDTEVKPSNLKITYKSRR